MSCSIDVDSAAEHGADEEDDHAEQEDPLAAVHVGEPAPERDRRDLGEQIGGEHPGVVVDAVQVADHRRHRGGDDRAVERGEEHARDRRHGREDDAALREPRRVRGPVAVVMPWCRSSAGTEHAREVTDAFVDRSFGSAEVLDEQPPQEGGEHVGRGLDVGVGREVGAEQERLVPALAPLGVERSAHLRARRGRRGPLRAASGAGSRSRRRSARTRGWPARRSSGSDRRGIGHAPRVRARSARGTPHGRARPSRRSGSRGRAPSRRPRRRAPAC